MLVQGLCVFFPGAFILGGFARNLHPVCSVSLFFFFHTSLCLFVFLHGSGFWFFLIKNSGFGEFLKVLIENSEIGVLSVGNF
jgi:hypothetical protein